MTKPLKDLKSSIEKITKDSLGVASQAHKIVTDGVQRLADHELKALNDTYKSVLASVKAAKGGESIKDVAAKQLDAMQDAVTRLISSAKDSLAIVGDTRSELSGLLEKGIKTGKVAEAELAKVTAQAKKVVAEVKTAAADAQKQAIKAGSKALASAEKVGAQAMASAEKVASSAQADAIKAVNTVKAEVKADVKAIKNRVGSVLDVKPKAMPSRKPVVVSAKPSANSRASRATSTAKVSAPAPAPVVAAKPAAKKKAG